MTKQRRTRPGRPVQGRFGLAFMGIIALAAALAAGLQFIRLLDSEREMDAIVREDAMWAVFQTDRHLRELHAQARMIGDGGGDTRQHEVLILAYDILYSRVRLLERGTFLLDGLGDGRLSTDARTLQSSVVDLAPRFDALDPAATDYRATVAELAAELSPLRTLSNDLLIRANADTNALRVSERAFRAGIQDQLAGLAVLLILAVVGSFVLLVVQLRRLMGSNQRMALLQERSRRRALRAQAASRAKSTFLATMSHEIRTPLNGIIASAELVALQPLPDATARRVGTITSQAFLLRDLIDGILDVSRLEANSVETTRVETELVELAAQLSQAFAPQAESHGLELSIDLPVVRLGVNQARLRQVLVNLIGNALKFSHRGQVKVRGTLPRPDLLRVEVEDQGIGIAPEDIPSLFRDFSQIDGSHARGYGGSGLGLAICRRVVEGLGGRIGVESAPGQGSRFWFEMPVTPLVAAQPGARPGGDAVAPTPAMPNRRLKILIVEDTEVNLEVLRAILQTLGHDVEEAHNGHEAVELARTSGADLVLMDVQMPEMDGLEATRRIRRFAPELPIVGVTANAFTSDRRACLAVGMSDFLAKPVTISALVEVIARLALGAKPERADRATGQPGPVAQVEKLEPDGSTGSTTLEDPVAEVSEQLADLLNMLGVEPVLKLVRRFESELPDLRNNLSAPLESAPHNAAKAQDEVLHSFKGASLTLGMTAAGQLAQTMRAQLPIGAQEIERLVAQAREEAVQAQYWLSLRVNA